MPCIKANLCQKLQLVGGGDYWIGDCEDCVAVLVTCDGEKNLQLSMLNFDPTLCTVSLFELLTAAHLV